MLYEFTSVYVLTSVGKGWGRGIEHFDFFYLIYWRKQGRGIENWYFSIPFSYTGSYYKFWVFEKWRRHPV